MGLHQKLSVRRKELSRRELELYQQAWGETRVQRGLGGSNTRARGRNLGVHLPLISEIQLPAGPL